MTTLKVSDLQHTYPNGVVAVSNVNVEIQQGEQISVVGQNGSGKTTLVKHWNGLLKPTQGNVYVGELDTCLLYTSPSPRDQRGSRMPSSA